MGHRAVFVTLVVLACFIGAPAALAGCCSGGAPGGCGGGVFPGWTMYKPGAGASAGCCGLTGYSGLQYGASPQGRSAASALPPCCQGAGQVGAPPLQTRGPVRGADTAPYYRIQAASGVPVQRNPLAEQPVKPYLRAAVMPGASATKTQDKELPLLAVLLGGLEKRTEKPSTGAAVPAKEQANTRSPVTAAQPVEWNNPVASWTQLGQAGAWHPSARSVPSCCAPGSGAMK